LILVWTNKEAKVVRTLYLFMLAFFDKARASELRELAERMGWV